MLGGLGEVCRKVRVLPVPASEFGLQVGPRPLERLVEAFGWYLCRRFAQWSRDRGLSAYERSSSDKGVGRAPMPPAGNPELALVLAGVPDSLAQTGADLYAVINRCRGRRQPGHAGARRTAPCGRCCC
ncbi:hypothetical protein [Streptomyces sp. NPDC091217]|uniref:hypothetical protein n=1 Tax=Streptomyces sp. NPDC091217 TaxID=3365975 RepID=UPI0038021575